ncbi:MAG: fructose-1,6-bisphosphatase class 1 [Phycisphaerae bacterium]|nr:MAG: class 1 fructose-bisphosphatase [Planctomycetia bacterium]RIK71306.1 MAG: class 1 fructose-bisphosphatase [Planctomycetota bacterium]GJQ26423.1 MAG: fructose-1,6-bisphosphatase class 1 [Phycisphaerae bacterium]
MSTQPTDTIRSARKRDNNHLVTIQEHILCQQRHHQTATGGFSWLLSGITLAARIISANVRRAGILDVLGEAGSANVSGEQQQKLDVLANKSIQLCLEYRGNVGIIASEELDEPTVLTNAGSAGKYVVVFDPLDGSSNIDVNVSVGTIFSILERDPDGFNANDPAADVLQAGMRQLAAGYIVYGSSTVLVYTTGEGVHFFTLDPSVGAFVLSNENVRMPEKGKIYSVNEGNYNSFPEGVKRYLQWCKTEEAGPFTSRYIGSLVADFHRTLLRGGIFLYPPTAKAPTGKLRLLYEANPIAFIAEQAGGMATDGKGRILEKNPTSLHQRTPLFVGSKWEMDRLQKYLEEFPD